MDLDSNADEVKLEYLVVKYQVNKEEEVLEQVYRRLEKVIGQRSVVSHRKERMSGFHPVEVEDLQQELKWLLILVVRDFDPTMGVPFVALFQRCATNHLNSLFNIRHRNLNSRVSYECSGIEVEVGTDGDTALKLTDILPAKDMTAEEQMSVEVFLSSFKSDFWEVVERFGPRTENIFKMLLKEKLKVKDIADRVGISGARVSQLIKEVHDAVRRDLGEKYTDWYVEAKELAQKGAVLTFGSNLEISESFV